MDDIIDITLKKTNKRVSITYWDRVVECEISEKTYGRIQKLLHNNISPISTRFRIIIEKSRAVWQEKTEYAKEVRLEKDPPIEYDISEDLYNIILGVLEKEGKQLYDGPHREMD